MSKNDITRKLDQRIRQMEEVHKMTRGSADPLKGYTDLELKALESGYQKNPQVEDSKIARKLDREREREIFREKRAVADIAVRVKYPEASDPNSRFSKIMEAKIDEYGLGNSPKGRLAAAKLAEIELENKQGDGE